jgi:hypothetical protein
MEAAMSTDINNPALEEMRRAFRAMIRRLQANANNIPDWLVRKAKLAHLEIFLAHSETIDDSDEMINFCVTAVAKMKCSIDGHRYSLRGPLIDLAIEGLQDDDEVDLKSVIYAGLFK